MKIALATDHAGFELKEKIKKYLIEKGYEVEDFGALSYDKDDDYPDFISQVASFVSRNDNVFGVVFGKSGTGEAIVANKYPRVRAVLGVNEKNVKLAREHNDANVLSLGSDIVSFEEAAILADVFLATSFSNEERHVRRIKKIEAIENDPNK